MVRDDTRGEVEHLFRSVRETLLSGQTTLLNPSMPGWPDTYIVRRWFTANGERAEVGEIMIPGLRFWADYALPEQMLDYGYVMRLTEKMRAPVCAEDRLWRTWEAFQAHGCSGAPAELGALKPDTAAAVRPRMPTRPADVRKWRAIWWKVKPELRRGKRYTELADLFNTDDTLSPSPDLVADVIRAGEAGLLDD